MGPRPGNWALLGAATDPLPGDPWAVRNDADHYQSLADDVQRQVELLRILAEDDNRLVGDYAPPLRESARLAAEHVGQAHGRLNETAQQLARWAPVLEQARTDTGDQLRRAESHAQTMQDNAPAPTPVDPADPEAVAAAARRQARHDEAAAGLRALRSAFESTMVEAQKVARDVADKIRAGADDALRDGTFDGVRKWIHDNAALLKQIANVLTWVATAVVIVAIVVGTGGVGLAALLTAGALVIHSALAANGDGSWVDVALDVFALATLGAGALLTSTARGAYATRLGIQGYKTGTAAARTAFSSSRGLWAKAGTWLTRSNPVSSRLAGLKAGRAAFDRTLNAVFSGGTRVNQILMGGPNTAGMYRAIRGTMGELGPGFLLNTANRSLVTLRVVNGASYLVDAAGKAVGLGAAPPVSRWLDDHTVRNGGWW